MQHADYQKISHLLQIIAFCDFVYFRLCRFLPIYFIHHENGGSR